MGSPLSPIIAEFVLDELCLEIKDIFQNHIKFLTKYVDDSLFITLLDRTEFAEKDKSETV